MFCKGFVYELYMVLILKNCLVSFAKHRPIFGSAWVTDDPVGQCCFTDYTKISFVIFSYAFN